MSGKWQIDSYGNKWSIGTQFIRIDNYEDCSEHTEEEKENGTCDCREVWVGDDKSGNWDEEGIFNTYKEALQYVRNFMKENPNGWLCESKPKEEKEKVNFT